MRSKLLCLGALFLTMTGCQSWYVRENPDPKLTDEPPEAAQPERIRNNIRKMGENLSPAVLKTVLDDLIRAGRHAEPYMFEALKDPNPRRRSNAMFVLRSSYNPDIPGHVAPLLEDPVLEVRYEAAAVLVEKGHKVGISFLIQGLRHKNPLIRNHCAHVLKASTRMYFDFNAYDPKDKREFCVKKWENWWAKNGASFQFRR